MPRPVRIIKVWPTAISSRLTCWLNAAWVRDRGPRFLTFDGDTIDGRGAWSETPAMWLEVYRWYDTSLLGQRELLLERRATPRFGALQSVGRTQMRWPGELKPPDASAPLFWTLDCRLTAAGRFRQTLFRLPEVRMFLRWENRQTHEARVIMDVLRAPVLSNPPVTLQEFAALFRGEPGIRVEYLHFAAPGGAYSETCAVEFLRATE